MYYYNRQETENNSIQYISNVNNIQYPSMDNTSFDELPTQFLNNHQLVDSNSFINDALFDNTWDFFDQPPQTMDPQEAILFSDPNFLRQHQLLQEEHTRLQPETSKIPATDEGKKQPKRSQRRPQVFQDDNEKIDHQRRFNELQARFRVNYARKPQQSSQSKTKQLSKDETPSHPTEIELPPSNTTPSPGPGVLTTPPIAGGGIVMSTKKAGEEFSMTKEYLSSSFPSRTMPIQIQRVSRGPSSSHIDAESYQKQLDSQLDKVDFNDITVSELKEMLRQRGKPATGKKAILLQRLQEERELAKGGRKRHSQPLPLSYSEVPQQRQRPNSFQGTSTSSSGSVSSGSPPRSPGGQLNRSIANLHIGSPPTTSRRYSPYSPNATTRLGSSPKMSCFEYSSSVPSSVNLSTPVPSSSSGMMLASSYSASRLTPGRYYNNTKSYKPFTSSALATPDREEEINPFDAYYAGGVDPPIKEEVNENSTVEWSDPDLVG